MNKKIIQQKRAIKAVLLILLLSAVGMTKGYAYDFSAVCSTGQTLYYNITDAANHYVELTCPGTVGYYGWSGYTQPTGNIILPESVQYNGTTFSVTSIGRQAFRNCIDMISIEIPNSVSSIVDYAFDGCNSLNSITIGNSVTLIAYCAFSGCSSLTSIEIPNSVTFIGWAAFSGCSSLTSIEIPNSVTSIESNPFTGCSGLEQVMVAFDNAFYDSRENCNAIIRTSTNALISGCKNTEIPSSVTSIGQSAFSSCTSLTAIEIPSSVTSIGNHAFSSCISLTAIEIPSSVTWIGDYAFQGCNGLTGSLIIPNSVTSIGNNAFAYCSGFTGSLNIPNSVTSIGDRAFYRCSGFTDSLTIPNSVTTIGMYAFDGCSGFTGDLTIGNSVTSIGKEAFYGCNSLNGVHYTGDITQWCNITFGSALSNPLYYAHKLYINDELITELNIPEMVTEIKQYAFYGCSGFTGSLTIPSSVTTIGHSAFSDCSGFSGSLTIPNSVTWIGDFAFSSCGFTGLTIPNSVTSIGGAAFGWCTGFTGDLVIPNSVDTIESFTFYLCCSFTSVVIPETVTYIGSVAFGCCSGMQSITVLADNPPVLDDGAAGPPFYNVPKSIPVYVPAGTIVAYQAAPGWSEFTNYHEIESTSYTVTVSANPAEGGSVTGVGTYTEGTICTLTATANEGYSFVNWTENNEVVSTNANYSFTVSENRNLVANFALSGTITNHWTPEGSSYSEIMAMYSVIQIDGVEQYSNTLEVGVFCGDECRGSAIASEFNLTHRYLAVLNVFGENGHQLTFKLYDHSIGQELNLTSPATVIFDVNGYGNPLEPYVLNFTSSITHSQALNNGWNWWSTYVEQNGIDGLDMLENSIGSAGVRIQGRNGTIDQFEYQGSSYWYGSLTSIENEQMYKIRTNAACNAVMVGYAALPANHPITINGGWNWIGFPCSQSVSVNDAMSGFTPVANDVIKGRNGSTTYVSYGSTSLWYGTLNTLEPGQGYMYKSNNSTSKTLVFQTGRGEETVTNVTEENSFFTPNTDDFSDNMLVTAVINMDGQELRSEDYEIAAYVGNECRGNVRLMYVEPFDRYVAFLLVFGEAEEEIHFVLTDGNDVAWSDDLLTYTDDGLEGTVTEPATLHFGTLGLNDNEHDFVNIFPNPSNGIFNIEGNGLRKIEVVNAFGQTVLLREVENSLMQIDLGDKAAGVYLLRVITNNGITTKQLVKE